MRQLIINRDRERLLVMAAFCAALAPGTGFAQAPPPVILQVDLENMVQYWGDVSDPSKLATVLTPTTPTIFKLSDVSVLGGHRSSERRTGQGHMGRARPAADS